MYVSIIMKKVIYEKFNDIIINKVKFNKILNEKNENLKLKV